MLKIAKISLVAAAIITTSMATSAVASDVLATVNGQNVTKQDAQEFLVMSGAKVQYTQLDQAQKNMIKEKLVEKVLFSELAKKEGVENDPEFKATIEKIKDGLVVNVWMKKQLDGILVSDSEAKEFYEKNKAKFLQPASMHARHILVKTEKEAQDIIKELVSHKDEKLKLKFIELAKVKSTGPSGPKGGDLGTFTKEQMVPEFSAAAEALNNGEITKTPVKTQFGYHVIYLEEKMDSKPVSYEQAKAKILTTLKQKQFTVKVAEIAKELKSKAKIVDMSAEANNTK